MKKTLIFLMVFPFLLASCSNDEKLTNSDIIGTWVSQSVYAKEVKTNNEDATKVIKDNIVSSYEKMTVVLSNDGKITVTGPNFNDDPTGTYSLTGNILTLTIDGEVQVLPISLSGNTLKIDTDKTKDYQKHIERLFPGGKNVIVLKVIETITLKRN